MLYQAFVKTLNEIKLQQNNFFFLDHQLKSLQNCCSVIIKFHLFSFLFILFHLD